MTIWILFLDKVDMKEQIFRSSGDMETGVSTIFRYPSFMDSIMVFPMALWSSLFILDMSLP